MTFERVAALQLLAAYAPHAISRGEVVTIARDRGSRRGEGDECAGDSVIAEGF